MTARLQHITIRDELPGLRERARQRARRERRERISQRLGVVLMTILCVTAAAVLWASMTGRAM